MNQALSVENEDVDPQYVHSRRENQNGTLESYPSLSTVLYLVALAMTRETPSSSSKARILLVDVDESPQIVDFAAEGHDTRHQMSTCGVMGP